MRALILVGVAVSGWSCGVEGPPAPKARPPNGARIALECEAHGLLAFDATRTLITGRPLHCTAHVADRIGEPVNAAPVTFLVEAGRVTSAGTTSAIGTLEVLHETALPLPVDVTPGVFSWTTSADPLNTGELLVPTWMAPDRWTENPAATSVAGAQTFTLREPRRPDPIRLKPDGSGRVENNPRDNLVTLIAIVDGEEGFSDTNGNGTFDQGESFTDLTEPFVDSNDNGTFDADEQLVDVNGNRQWDGRNGKWDSATKLWVPVRFLWTGVPEERDAMVVVPGVVGQRPTVVFTGPPIALTCPGTGALCSQAESVSAAVYLADPWFNALTRLGATDDCDAAPAGVLPVRIATVSGPGARDLWPAGELVQFQVADKRDGTSQVARRSPPLSFNASLACHFTGAPGGQPADLVVGTLAGTIE